MKWCTSLALAVAPLAVAALNVARDAETEFAERGWDIKNGISGHGITAHSLTEIIIIWVNPGGGAATTTYNEKATVTQTVTADAGYGAPPAASAATHTVKVGGPGGLVFQPDQLNNVPIGDTVIFEFLSQNHTVTQSGFDVPCKKLEGGLDSGFQANPNNTVSPAPQVAMQVMVSTPLWFYCRQKGHCGKGMVFSINPTAAKTQSQFQQMAIAQNGTGEGTPITGGSGGSAPPPAAETSAYAPPPPQRVLTEAVLPLDKEQSAPMAAAHASFPAALGLSLLILKESVLMVALVVLFPSVWDPWDPWVSKSV
ncbi:putative GPI-anchored cupredoxin [Cladobotryum mycophilum]|uniref:GPI-anchored cupredoxin n=1 Tax=Cladobotryum mycophilum TaxID=491253 RepID=A0ABR0SAY6_9HYPO